MHAEPVRSVKGMDAKDREILEIIQADFPLEARPFAVVGEKTGLTEEEVMARTAKLRDEGIIRRIGGFFNSGSMGYVSVLCAMKLPAEETAGAAEAVGAYPGVTHSYLRNHEYNLWFTLIAPSEERKEGILAEIEEKTGFAVSRFPVLEPYKLRAVFDLGAGEKNE